MRKHIIPLLVSLLALPIEADNVLSRLVDTLVYSQEISGTTGGGRFSPYWMTNNHYGVSSEHNRWALWRRALHRDQAYDLGRKWQVGWGLELSDIYAKGGGTVLQEIYADVQYKKVRLSVGQKERPSELLNPMLSSGGLASGMNARPIPQLRVEVPDFWTIPGLGGWLALRGHIAYGMYTDNKWQREFIGEGQIYSKNSLYHSKAGFLRIGNTKKFPITVTGGLEMNTQFSGTAYNVRRRADDNTGFQGGTVHMSTNLKDFWNVFVPGGSDATDGDYSNREGNTVGAWYLSIDLDGKDLGATNGWGARIYAQHMFEDESQMFWEYGWKDFLLGTEIRLPRNPVVGTILYEYLATKDQTGPIYHDATATIPDQISALDNYYNHSIYGAWQHAGFGLGNGLLISPRYNSDGSLTFKHNRIIAHHLGISGTPSSEFFYRLLFSYEKSWGTYNLPLVDPQEGWTIYTQAIYNPRWFKRLALGLAYGHNGGDLLGNSNGVQLSLYFKTKFSLKKKK